MKYSFIVFFALLSGMFKTASAQWVGVRGTMSEKVRGVAGQVLSDKGGAVPYAHVFFMYGKNTIVMACDALGTFSWQTNKVPDSLQIRVTAMGYKTLESCYSPKTQGNRLFIRMQQEAIALNEVIVTAKKVYMVVKGDTLEYKAESFKTLEGDFIGDLLRKMPGVSSEEGPLMVNGEPIYRIYVNGEDFGNNNEVLSNIRADNIKNIQVYDERNKEDQADGMKYGRRRTVMNVVTKQKVDRWKDWRNGNFLLGTGRDISNNPTSHFKQKWNLKFNYKVPIEKKDSKEKSGKSLNLAGEYTNIAKTNDRQESKFTLDYNNGHQNDRKKKLVYRTDNMFHNGKGYTREINDRVYFPTSDYTSRTYTSHNVGKSNDWGFHSKHSFVYKKLVGLNFTLKGSKMENDRNTREHSETNDTLTSSVNMLYHTKKLLSSGHTSLSFPVTKAIGIQTSLDLGKGKTENQQIDTLPESNRQVLLKQEYNQQDANWIIGIGYSKTLSLFKFSIGYDYKTSMDKEEGKSMDQLTSHLDTNGTRDYTFYQQTHDLGGNIVMSTKKSYLIAKLNVQRIFRNHVERFPHRKQYQNDFLPIKLDLLYTNKQSPTFNWDLTYKLTPKLPTVAQTRREIETSNPLFLRAGNPNLKPEKQHYIQLIINQLSVSNAASLNGKVIYTLTQDFIATNEKYFQKTTFLEEYDYTVIAGATLITSKNTKASHNISVEMEYSKYSGLLESKIDLRGRYNYRKTPSFTQGKANDLQTNQGSLQLKMITAFSRKMEFVLNSSINLSNARNDLDKASNIFTQNHALTFRTSLIPKFNISSTFSYRYVKNYATGHQTDLPDLKMEIKRNLGRFASLKLEGFNLLNRQNGVGFYKSAMYMSRTESAQTGRYVMLTFSQKLR